MMRRVDAIIGGGSGHDRPTVVVGSATPDGEFAGVLRQVGDESARMTRELPVDVDIHVPAGAGDVEVGPQGDVVKPVLRNRPERKRVIPDREREVPGAGAV